MGKARALASAAILVAGAVALVYLYTRPGEEERIRRLFAAAEQAVEQRNLRKVMRLVSPDYHDPAGADYNDVREAFRRAFATTWRFRVTIFDLRVALTGGGGAVARAYVVVDVLGLGGVRQYRLQGPMKFDLAKESGRWRVISSEGAQEMVRRSGFELP